MSSDSSQQKVEVEETATESSQQKVEVEETATESSQQKVEETKPTPVQEDEETAETLLQAAAKEFYIRSHKPGREILTKLAKDLEELAGIPKSKIARMIVRAFRQNNVKINRSYIYLVLGQEYKSKAQSDASSQAARERKEDGYDYKTGDYVKGGFGTYDIEHVADYGRSTLVRIVNAQHAEILDRDFLKKRIEELEKPKH
jgi:hypothetical protein